MFLVEFPFQQNKNYLITQLQLWKLHFRFTCCRSVLFFPLLWNGHMCLFVLSSLRLWRRWWTSGSPSPSAKPLNLWVRTQMFHTYTNTHTHSYTVLWPGHDSWCLCPAGEILRQSAEEIGKGNDGERGWRQTDQFHHSVQIHWRQGHLSEGDKEKYVSH